MPPSRRNTSGSSQLIDYKLDIESHQGSPPIEWLRKSGAGGALLIGSHIDDLTVGYADYLHQQSLPILTSKSYDLPPKYVLALIDIAHIVGVDDPRRMQQLAWCCEHRRKYGTCKVVFGYAFCSGRKSAELSKLVEGYGARFFPLARSRNSLVEEVLQNGV
jgi:hypothetical protein